MAQIFVSTRPEARPCFCTMSNRAANASRVPPSPPASSGEECASNPPSRNLSEVMPQVPDVIAHEIFECSGAVSRNRFPPYAVEIVPGARPGCDVERDQLDRHRDVRVERVPQGNQLAP